MRMGWKGSHTQHERDTHREDKPLAQRVTTNHTPTAFRSVVLTFDTIRQIPVGALLQTHYIFITLFLAE